MYSPKNGAVPKKVMPCPKTSHVDLAPDQAWQGEAAAWGQLFQVISVLFVWFFLNLRHSMGSCTVDLGIHREMWTISLHIILPAIRAHQASAGSGWHCWAGQGEQNPQKLPPTSSPASDWAPEAALGMAPGTTLGMKRCWQEGREQPEKHPAPAQTLGTLRPKAERDYRAPAPRIQGRILC